MVIVSLLIEGQFFRTFSHIDSHIEPFVSPCPYHSAALETSPRVPEGGAVVQMHPRRNCMRTTGELNNSTDPIFVRHVDCQDYIVRIPNWIKAWRRT